MRFLPLFLACCLIPAFAGGQGIDQPDQLVAQVRTIAALAHSNANEIESLKDRVSAFENQTVIPAPAPGGEPQGVRSGFHGALVKAIRAKVKSGELTRRKAMRIRVAMISPAVRQKAEDLAVMQMAASGDEGVPMSADGSVDRASIDWEGLIGFLERLIPLILQLIDLFG